MQIYSTYRFKNEGTRLGVDYHQHDPEHSGAQSQGAKALLILQEKLSVPQSVEIVSLHGSCPLGQRHGHFCRVHAVPSDQGIKIDTVHLGVAL